MEFGLLPTFPLLDVSLLPTSVSPSYSGVVSMEQALSWTKTCASSMTSDLCPLPF